MESTLSACFLIIVLILTLAQPSLQAPPFIANQPITVNLFETVNDNHQVACITCIHTVAKTVRLVAVNPVTVTQGTSNCLNCFTVRQVSPVSDYCIFYSRMTSPAQQLDFSLAKVYNIKVECTDGLQTSTADVDVRLIPNLPPVITGPSSVSCPAPVNALSTGAFANIYTGIVATDDAGANLFYSMTSDPVNNVFSIEPTTGRIYTLSPVSRFCHHTVIFYVTVSDNTSTPLAPLIVTCSITNYYTSPMVSNANRDYSVGEDVPINSNIYVFATPPSTLPITYSIQSVLPSGATYLFKFNGNALQAAAKLNYENAFYRDPKITLVADNGICPPQTYFLNLHIQDKNDAPVVVPKNVMYTFPEESAIAFSPVQSVNDEDFEDTAWDYTITAGNVGGVWVIDALGKITTSVPYDVEQYPANVVLTVKVADRKGPAFDTQTVRISIVDVNDNRPTFTQTAFVFTVTECSQPGFIAGRLTATDADTSANNNNVVVFDVVSMNNIAVNGQGEVMLTANVSVGMTTPVMVGAKDLGTPPKTSATQASVSLAVIPCPTTTPTPGTNQLACNNGDSSNAGDFLWTQIASLLAALAGSS